MMSVAAPRYAAAAKVPSGYAVVNPGSTRRRGPEVADNSGKNCKDVKKETAGLRKREGAFKREGFAARRAAQGPRPEGGTDEDGCCGCAAGSGSGRTDNAPAGRPTFKQAEENLRLLDAAPGMVFAAEERVSQSPKASLSETSGLSLEVFVTVPLNNTYRLWHVHV